MHRWLNGGCCARSRLGKTRSQKRKDRWDPVVTRSEWSVKRGAEAAGLDSKRLDGQSEWIRHIGEGMFACRCVSVPSNRLERRNLAESTFSPAGSSWGLGVGRRPLARAPRVLHPCRLLLSFCHVSLVTTEFAFPSLSHYPTADSHSPAFFPPRPRHRRRVLRLTTATPPAGPGARPPRIPSSASSFPTASHQGGQEYTPLARLLTLLIVSAILPSLHHPCPISTFARRIHIYLLRCGLQYPPSL